MTPDERDRWLAEANRIYGYALGSAANQEAVANALGAIADILAQGEDPVISVYAVHPESPDKEAKTFRDGDVRYNIQFYPKLIETIAREAEEAGMESVLRFFDEDGVINGLLVQHEGKTVHSIGDVK